jgi:GT2 family glycosyltransferase
MSAVDIIIVNHNSTDHLLSCLQSIYASLREVEAKIYVQDNASTDDPDRLSSRFPQVLLAKNSCNIGFAKAVNIALKQSSSPYVTLLNPDTHVMSDFFKLTRDYLNEDLGVGIVGPKVLNHDGSVQGSARSFPTPLTALFGRSSYLSKRFPNNPISRQNVLTSKSDGVTPMEVGWVSGASMVVRREALEQVGLLDERFFMYWEDADLCKRMWDSGWKVVYLPKASVVHYVGGSSGDTPLFRTILEFHKSSYRLFMKHAKGPLRLAQPLAIWGLALRFLFVLLMQEMVRWSGRGTKNRGISPK